MTLALLNGFILTAYTLQRYQKQSGFVLIVDSLKSLGVPKKTIILFYYSGIVYVLSLNPQKFDHKVITLIVYASGWDYNKYNNNNNNNTIYLQLAEGIV